MYLGLYVGALSTVKPTYRECLPMKPLATLLISIAKSGTCPISAGHEPSTMPTRLGFGKPILTIYSLAARLFGIAVSPSPYFSNHASVPFPFRDQVRLCFNHSGFSGAAPRSRDT